MKYVIVRSGKAGVFAGKLAAQQGDTVVLRNARRLWYWKGAATLSEMAMKGTKNAKECKFPCEVDRVEIFDVAEILDVTPEARESIASVPVWSARRPIEGEVIGDPHG